MLTDHHPLISALLRGGFGGSPRTLRHARDLQHRSGSQFTCTEFICVLKEHQIRISMDGKGRWRDNIFVERLWRSVKYEEVYLHAYESVTAARTGITRCVNFFDTRRPHTALYRRIPG